MKVSIAKLIRDFGTLSDKALAEPPTITKNGRDWPVLISAEEYARLKRRDRRVVRLEDFTVDEMTQVANAEQPSVDAFVDDPPEPNERLRRTMKTPAPWEKK